MSNPLLEAHVLPPFKSIAPEHAVPAVEAILAEFGAVGREHGQAGVIGLAPGRAVHHRVQV